MRRLPDVAGRINDADVAEVRDRARIDEIVGSYLQLRNAGGGSKKGLCPFHDEKTPSFQVTPAKGLFYCFGCGEGGDVITFVQKVDNLSFAEAVQRLADKVGVQLRYTDSGGPSVAPGLRMRLLEAHQAAAEFFAQQLTSPDALVARQFLDQRGFDREAAERFGVGYAPRGGRELADHLRARGFSHSELVTGGLVRERGWDFFQGRLLWPIRDSATSVLGFGARRLHDDDRMPAKYVNTPETPLYKKSQVLYGLDLARTAIGKKSQAVIVEGYTDVMACHLAGVDTAIASCGTAFGNDHAKLLRRLMGDHDAFNGEVIFTFDGDAAGQAAAMKVFSGDANFISQTYVAVEPSGLDPCDLRLQQGEAEVRELVARRVPLYRFVMGNVIAGFDLDRVEGRVQALRAAAPLVASIRDKSMVSGYVRELANWLVLDVDEVRTEVMRAASRGSAPAAPPDRPVQVDEPVAPQPSALPDPHDRDLVVERETLKLALHTPDGFDPQWYGLTTDDFAHPAYRAVFNSLQAAASAGEIGPDWTDRVRGQLPDERLDQLVVQLVVEPLTTNREPDAAFTRAYAAKLQLIRLTGEIGDMKSKLQRTNPVTDTGAYNQMFSVLLGLESRRARLKQLAVGDV
ncbi:DNA primase [Microlunatus sp. Y2014]|uniref:DNA primase n=1 Tax=Microlunatus sp. Y2014 TaxID=3418488 RepID=UPI003DA75979